MYNGDDDDDLTKQFKKQLLERVTNTVQLASSSVGDVLPAAPGPATVQSNLDEVAEKRKEMQLDRKHKTGKFDPNYSASAVQSELEMELGRKHKGGGMSQHELEQRYPQLKNAPTEGSFTNSIQVHHKPFNDVIRYVQCTRCGQWGHKSGDRECALKDYNPQDFARQQREDPMSSYTTNSAPMSADSSQKDSSALEQDKQRLIHAHVKSVSSGSLHLRHANKQVTNIGGSNTQYDLIDSDEEEEGNGAIDSEHQEHIGITNIGEELLLLASLTEREKKLLIKKLQVCGRYIGYGCI